MWLQLISVLLGLLVIYFFRNHPKYFHMLNSSNNIEGPPALPIIGNGLLFLNKSSRGKRKFSSQKTFFMNEVFDSRKFWENNFTDKSLRWICACVDRIGIEHFLDGSKGYKGEYFVVMRRRKSWFWLICALDSSNKSALHKQIVWIWFH